MSKAMRLSNDPRNYFLLFMDSVLFTNAMTFLSINTVITLRGYSVNSA